jgi:hypothetical protein
MNRSERILDVLAKTRARPKTIYRYYPNDAAAQAAGKVLYDAGNKYVMSRKLATKNGRARLSLIPRPTRNN